MKCSKCECAGRGVLNSYILFTNKHTIFFRKLQYIPFARLTTGFPLFPAFRGASSSLGPPTHHWFSSFSRFPGCFLFPWPPDSPLVSLFLPVFRGVSSFPGPRLTTGFLTFPSFRGVSSSPSCPTHLWFPAFSFLSSPRT